MPKLTLEDLDVKDKKVLMRVDFNVPLDDNQNITDDTRIKATLPSIQYVLDHGGSLILMSHLGRPKGQVVKNLSLKPCAKALSELLGKRVLLAPDCIGEETEKLAEALKPGQILLLENLRFHPEEENPEIDPSFASRLAKLGDLYVNDAFGTAHRAHASIDAVPRMFPGHAAAGFLLEKEIQFLGDALTHPKRPFCTILGGAKVSTKCGLIEALMKKADAVMIGGAMAYTFFKALSIPIGDSPYEEAFLNQALKLLEQSQKGEGKLILPKDILVATEIKAGASVKLVKASEGIPPGYQGVGIGPETVEEFSKELKKAATVLWNGPLGVFEIPEFSEGTFAIARIIAGLNLETAVSRLKAVTIVGGGDSIAAVLKAGVADKITHLSTGGGASLEYIEFGTLPGIEALTNRIIN